MSVADPSTSLPTPDQIELFFWQVFGSSAPPLSTQSYYKQHPQPTIMYFDITDRRWRRDASKRFHGRWRLEPVVFRQIGLLKYATLYGDFFHVAEDYPTIRSKMKTPFTIGTNTDTDAESNTTWKTFIDKSYDTPLLLRVQERKDYIDIWCYQNLFMIIEADKWMFMTLDAFFLFVKKGLVNGRYTGMYVLPNSAFINFNTSKLSKTPLQAMNNID